jgi:hypothetical protein
MTSERTARAWFMQACEYVRALEKASYAVALKGDSCDLNQHLERLRVARVVKAQAFEELRLWRGAAPRRRPVKLYT